MKRILALLATLLFFIACTGDVPRSDPQSWNDLEFLIEARPPIIQPGMNEFLVFANRKGNRPVADLIISLRVQDQMKWVQAIQDGHVGVYRRAMRVNDPMTDHLFVQVRQGENETVLDFPLSYSQAKTKN